MLRLYLAFIYINESHMHITEGKYVPQFFFYIGIIPYSLKQARHPRYFLLLDTIYTSF